MSSSLSHRSYWSCNVVEPHPTQANILLRSSPNGHALHPDVSRFPYFADASIDNVLVTPV